jgi:predicted Abi (CAAX) family protease
MVFGFRGMQKAGESRRKPAKSDRQSEKYLACEPVHGTGNPHPLLECVNPRPQSSERPIANFGAKVISDFFFQI